MQAVSKHWAGIVRLKMYKRFDPSEQYFAIVRSRLLHAINYLGNWPLAERPPVKKYFLDDAKTKQYLIFCCKRRIGQIYSTGRCPSRIAYQNLALH
jgi:hypothetical protein